jgi:hypothetical protein
MSLFLPLFTFAVTSTSAKANLEEGNQDLILYLYGLADRGSD